MTERLDQHRLLDQAAVLVLQAQKLLKDDGRETVAAWQLRADAWAERFANTPVVRTSGPRSGTTTRWRDISPAGDIAADPTPDLPDDPDEGETGPPEVQA